MLWVLLCVAIVLATLVALGLAALRTWRQTMEFTRELGRAGETVAGVSEGLNAEMAARQPPVGRGESSSRRPDSRRPVR